MGVEDNPNQPILFSIGQRFKQLQQICPNCKEGELKIDKMHNRLVCISCGFETEYKGEIK